MVLTDPIRPPFQSWFHWDLDSQGVALGCYGRAFGSSKSATLALGASGRFGRASKTRQ